MSKSPLRLNIRFNIERSFSIEADSRQLLTVLLLFARRERFCSSSAGLLVPRYATKAKGSYEDLASSGVLTSGLGRRSKQRSEQQCAGDKDPSPPFCQDCPALQRSPCHRRDHIEAIKVAMRISPTDPGPDAIRNIQRNECGGPWDREKCIRTGKDEESGILPALAAEILIVRADEVESPFVARERDDGEYFWNG
jgi:hypothetical protein